MSDKTDSKGPSKKADDKKPSEKKANDKVTSTKTDHKRTGDRETSEKKASEKTTGEKKHTGDKTSDKKANDKMENLKSETAKKENDKKTTNTKTDKAENKNATFKVDDEKTYLTIPTPSEPADSISRVSLTSDIFHDSELSNSNKLKRKRDDNTEPSWALATFAADDDTRQQNHEEKKYEARKYLNGFQKQYKLSDKAHSFVTDIARALALHAVGLPLDTGVLDLLQCEIVLSPGARWDSETGADERFLGFGIKCPPEKEIKINCEVSLSFPLFCDHVMDNTTEPIALGTFLGTVARYPCATPRSD
ncbi:hypothetical protein F5Y07DRAFT_379472 [Xylaria sp. FL0933]|nr:hypothetical protein F5Y07DRAFT_379472 [Xylaria sp. FL0933]